MSEKQSIHAGTKILENTAVEMVLFPFFSMCVEKTAQAPTAATQEKICNWSNFTFRGLALMTQWKDLIFVALQSINAICV